MAPGEVTNLERMLETLKKAVAELRDADVPFALGGSFSFWARGGPEPDDDVDLLIPPQWADEAAAVLSRAGLG
jgi:hypothetical protein